VSDATFGLKEKNQEKSRRQFNMFSYIAPLPTDGEENQERNLHKNFRPGFHHSLK
jgi:hypothetical protein